MNSAPPPATRQVQASGLATLVVGIAIGAIGLFFWLSVLGVWS